MTRFNQNISRYIGLILSILIGFVVLASSANAHAVGSKQVKIASSILEVVSINEEAREQLPRKMSENNDNGCDRSCPASCPPTTCMTGLTSYFDYFMLKTFYSQRVPVFSLRTNYSAISAGLFHPPRY